MSAGGPDGLMTHALRLAERGRNSTFPNPRVGCVIVRDGAIVGEGWHEKAGEPHAEVHALRAAGEQARGALVYVTLEPCSHQGRTGPCADALIAAGVRKVVAAMCDPNPRVAGQGIERLRAAGVEVQVGVMEAEARDLNRGFVSRMERGRPHVTLKLAASLDGRTAMASGESKWITGEAARADVHRLRAEAGAVLTGSATVLADDPQLNVRGVEGVKRVPDRIVLDSAARVPATAKVWTPDGARRIRICGPQARLIDGVESIGLALNESGRLPLDAVLHELAAREINSVFVECGATLAGAFLQAGLVDELVCYLAPCLLGEDARSLAKLPGLESLGQRVMLRFKDVRQVGDDLRVIAVPPLPNPSPARGEGL